MLLDYEKIQVEMARKGLTVSEIGKIGSCSRQRVNTIIQKAAKGQHVKPVTAGKLAGALGVDITEILK